QPRVLNGCQRTNECSLNTGGRSPLFLFFSLSLSLSLSLLLGISPLFFPLSHIHSLHHFSVNLAFFLTLSFSFILSFTLSKSLFRILFLVFSPSLSGSLFL